MVCDIARNVSCQIPVQASFLMSEEFAKDACRKRKN